MTSNRFHVDVMYNEVLKTQGYNMKFKAKKQQYLYKSIQQQL